MGGMCEHVERRRHLSMPCRESLCPVALSKCQCYKPFPLYEPLRFHCYNFDKGLKPKRRFLLNPNDNQPFVQGHHSRGLTAVTLTICGSHYVGYSCHVCSFHICSVAIGFHLSACGVDGWAL
jgi:hypothetical protein